MTEEPRDNIPEDELEDDEDYDDEITLDELEGDSSDADLLSPAFDAGGQPAAPQQPAQHTVDDDDDEVEYDDELTLEELGDDAAGFFEVYATPAPAPPPAAQPPDDQEMYEVEATRSDPPPGQASAPPSPPSPPPQAAHSSGTRPSDQDNIRRLHNVEVEVIATLGTTRMQIRDILGLQVGSVVELHRMVGEPVDVTLNGRLIARGEVVVVDEKFAIRVHEIAGNDD